MAQTFSQDAPKLVGGGCKKSTLALFCAFLVSACLAVLAWPVDALELSVAPFPSALRDDQAEGADPPGPHGRGVRSGGRIMLCPAPLGQEFNTRMLHSVQLTPVENIYRIREGRIWLWQERGKSHNAGLPFSKPDRGRFLYDGDWMIVQGGGFSRKSIIYRAGTRTLGRNAVRVPPGPWRELWRDYPGRRLVFSVSGAPLCLLLFSG